jgi:hypothetical protein
MEPFRRHERAACEAVEMPAGIVLREYPQLKVGEAISVAENRFQFRTFSSFRRTSEVGIVALVSGPILPRRRPACLPFTSPADFKRWM